MTNSWQEVSLGKILKRADRFEKKDEMQTYHFAGTYSFARGIFAGEVKEGSTFRLDKVQRIKKGDFIYCKIMAWEGAFGIAPEKVDDCVMSGAFVAYEVDQTQIDPKYLDYYFKQEPIWKSIGSQSTGTNVRRRSLHPDQFEKATIPLPPLTEQRRIVEDIEWLAARVNEAQRLREEADNEAELLFASYLKAVRHQLLESEFPKKKIGDIATVTSGGTPSRDNPLYWNGDIPWIKTGELIDGDIYNSEEHITEDGMKNSSARLFPPETILIALYGQGQTRGRTARLMIEATTNQACCAILPTPEILDSRFTQYWQRSLYYEMREKSHGGAQPNWNGGMIKNIEIALPPLDEQRRIVAYLDGLQAKVNALRELQSASGEELSALMPSILDKAFKGELLVRKSKPYFAYGSNMKIDRITAAERAPSARILGRAKILDKRLVFNKTSTDGSGKGNIVVSPSNSVWGVLFEIDEKEINHLDDAEKGYDRQDVVVFDENGNQIKAFTYISTKTDNTLKPYEWYLSLIIQGAHDNDLPNDYVEELKKFTTIPDTRKPR